MPTTLKTTTRGDRVLASLAVEPRARDLAARHGLRLELHGDHTFRIVHPQWPDAERVLLTVFTDRPDSVATNETILDVVRRFVGGWSERP